MKSDLINFWPRCLPWTSFIIRDYLGRSRNLISSQLVSGATRKELPSLKIFSIFFASCWWVTGAKTELGPQMAGQTGLNRCQKSVRQRRKVSRMYDSLLNNWTFITIVTKGNRRWQRVLHFKGQKHWFEKQIFEIFFFRTFYHPFSDFNNFLR